MSDSDEEEFDFNALGKEFNLEKIAFEAMAKFIVPLFKALSAEGLSIAEAAAVSAAILAQSSGSPPPTEEE